jgi:hypothetical protein
MKSLPILDHTRRLGAPSDWNHESDGICHTLEIVDTPDGTMISAWEMTDAERKRIAEGAPLFLHIQGTKHPVVGFVVGKAEDVTT